jgi:hypothetical protein
MKNKNEKNWVKLLPIAVGLLNKRPIKKNGGIAPEQIKTFVDDVIIRDALKDQGFEPSTSKEETWKQQNKNQSNYEKNQKNVFQKDTFVYLDVKKKHVFSKSFEDQVSIQKFDGKLVLALKNGETN